MPPAYERSSLAVPGDDELLALIDTLPPAKRQPNLLFGAVRFLRGPVDGGSGRGRRRTGPRSRNR